MEFRAYVESVFLFFSWLTVKIQHLLEMAFIKSNIRKKNLNLSLQKYSLLQF